MPKLKHEKYVSALPSTLVGDTIYYVRTGAGFDVYVTNSTGTIVAYPLNEPSSITDIYSKINSFLISLNFLSTDDFEYRANKKFKIVSVDNPDSVTYTISVEGTAYTLGNTINLYDDILVTTDSVGFLNLNCEVVP